MLSASGLRKTSFQGMCCAGAADADAISLCANDAPPAHHMPTPHVSTAMDGQAHFQVLDFSEAHRLRNGKGVRILQGQLTVSRQISHCP